MKIARRLYYCPVCGNEEPHETNHTGEIYCNCRACGNSPLYCREGDGNAGRPFKLVTLRVYRFNLENPADRRDYNELREALSRRGLTCHKVLDHGFGRPAGSKYLFSFDAIAVHTGETFKVYDPEQFKGQYVSDIGRVHDWYETIYPNNKIKAGYWLEFAGTVPLEWRISPVKTFMVEGFGTCGEANLNGFVPFDGFKPFQDLELGESSEGRFQNPTSDRRPERITRIA